MATEEANAVNSPGKDILGSAIDNNGLGTTDRDVVIEHEDPPPVILTAEQALENLSQEHERVLGYVADLEASNSSLKNKVNQLENQVATGIKLNIISLF